MKNPLKKNTPQTSIAGNMFIYIIGAIFLMGLLIVAMKGSFQEGSGIDAEKNILLVGQVQRYGAELERGVSYILRNGYSETDLRFAHPNHSSAYGLITDIPARQVFAPEGGGVEWRAPPAGSQIITTEWAFNSRTEINQVGTTCGVARCVDLIAFLPVVTKDFCMAVNNSLGISNPSGDAPVSTAPSLSWSVPFNGAFIYSGTLTTSGNYTDQKPEGCFKGTSGNYYYYRVLLAR